MTTEHTIVTKTSHGAADDHNGASLPALRKSAGIPRLNFGLVLLLAFLDRALALAFDTGDEGWILAGPPRSDS